MATPRATNITWHDSEVTRSARRDVFGHGGAVVWFTGLSGSGKSTVGVRVERELVERGVFTYMLDGDNIRHGLNSDLGFSPEDRVENIRRIGEVARLFQDAGAVVLAAFVSPYRADRDMVREKIEKSGGTFVEVHVNTSLDVCESRDPKGLYKKARAGEINNMTGLQAPYEPPLRAELVVDTGVLSVDESAGVVIESLLKHDVLSERFAGVVGVSVLGGK